MNHYNKKGNGIDMENIDYIQGGHSAWTREMKKRKQRHLRVFAL